MHALIYCSSVAILNVAKGIQLVFFSVSGVKRNLQLKLLREDNFLIILIDMMLKQQKSLDHCKDQGITVNTHVE